jgi:putative aldouronate transport system permease protein
MYGIQLAWKQFAANAGIGGSSWVGWEKFRTVFAEQEFWNAFRNTLIIAAMQLAIVFPFPVILSIIFNEMIHKPSKRAMQVVTTFPHFLSWVILASIVANLLGDGGVVNNLIVSSGGEKVNFLMNKALFRWILILTDVWKESGWSMILYLATITAIDGSLYEAATIDGANRFQKILYITWPGISTIVVATFVLRVGMIMNYGYMQVLNLYNPSVYEVGDIIDTYVYRITFQRAPDYGVSTAVGLFKGAINAALMLTAEAVSRKVNGEGLF